MASNHASLQVGGFVPFTTVDYPGHLAAVVFCQGCVWRCRYCHNPHLQPFDGGCWSWENILALLAERKNFLEAVVFSGGEPTAQSCLPGAMRAVKDLGFKIGLHTAGIFPELLAGVLPLVDWVGLDVKAPYDERYDRITGKKDSFEASAESLRLLLASGVNYELRTTVHPNLLTPDDLADIALSLESRGATSTNIQPFRPEGCPDSLLAANVLPGSATAPAIS
jgi:pyruvate formate lyase activating enzyme